MRRRSLIDPVLLAAAAVAPVLPGAAAPVALAALVALWIALVRPRRRVLAVAAVPLSAAVALLGWGVLRRDPASSALRPERLAVAYEAFWDDLDRQAEEVASRIGPRPDGVANGPDAFRGLARQLEGTPGSRLSLLLVDPDGEPVAWAGEGLLHDLEPTALPATGSTYRASFTAATVLAVRPLSAAPRPWRVVAGRSLGAEGLPFEPPGPAAAHDFRWSLADPAIVAEPGVLRIRAPGRPDLLVDPRSAQAAGGPSPDPGRWAWFATGLALLGVALVRGVSGLLLVRTSYLPASRLAGIAVPALAGAVAWCLAAGVEPEAAVALTVGLGAAATGFRWAWTRGRAWRPGLQGMAAVCLLGAGAFAYQLAFPPSDAGSDLVASASATALRVALAAAAFGLFALAGRGDRPGPPVRDAWACAAAGLFAAAAASHDLWPAALLLVAAAGTAAAQWLAAADLRRPIAATVLCLLAAAAAAVVWETAYRQGLKLRLARGVLPRMAPPAAAELDRIEGELASFFADRSVGALAPRDPRGLDRRDLAFALWRGSPLDRAGTLSAVVVAPLFGPRSSFAFGLPMREGTEVDWSAARWEEILLPVWQEALLGGESTLLHGGEPWARVRYWFLPRPGFRLSEPRSGEVAEALLREGLELAEPGAPLRDALYALYSVDGQPLVTPWRESPPLAPRLATGSGGLVATPGGRAWAFTRRGEDGIEVLYLPLLGPGAALERVGVHALGVLLVAAAAVLAVLLLALPRAAFRDALRRTLRSYSKRLLIVFTALLLVPLLALNIILLQVLEQRLVAEQRAAGEAALESAQRVLGEYALSLEPGFGLDTALDDELLVWLSRVIHHEVNLYWGSRVWASSKPELFTAGLLPRRIPGEIWARLAISGHDLASRTNRAGGATYLELYAPFKIPGVRAPERLFLSLPLLAQEEETAAEVASLRRKAILVTSALFLLLAAVGTRLARSFTAPLTEIVEGTRRIAAGATSLGLAPSELELAALAEAIDRMAERIAEGRERLVREKQVVERMVENITAGVVSLDRDRRVLMRNRVAAELLGAAVGEPLELAIARQDRLAPLAVFLAAACDRPEHRTVRLAPADADGEEREWSAVWVPVPGPGEPSALLVVEDVTEVLRGQRLEAWAEMARIIAHEIKNPLTPIRLSAEHMREVRASDPRHFDQVFERCTANILEQVGELQEIAREFSAYSRIPKIEARLGDLAAAVAEVTRPYRTAPPPGVAVELIAAPGEIRARFDAKLLGRAVRNLIENALRASADGGRVELRVERGDGEARIAVADRGPGVPPEDLPRIFDPYFSTHAGGTGLGLPIARRIAEEHGGAITARNLPGGGLEVAITLPTA